MLKREMRIGRRGWIVIAAAAFAFAALAIGLALFLSREPHLSSDAADGKYAHDCCGTIELRGGQMTANGHHWTGYVVEADAAGPYVLPDRFVGTTERGIELDGARPPIKLRLDTLPHPNRMVVPHLTGSVRFDRQARFRYQLPRR